MLPNLNGKMHLERFLESCYRSSYRNIRIYIVDNHSTDGAQSIPFHAENTTIFKLRRNIGVAAMNIGIDAAQRDGARYVFTADNDIILDKDCIAYLVGLMVKRQDLGMIAPLTFLQDYPTKLEGIIGMVNLAEGHISLIGKGLESMDGLPDVIEGDCVGVSMIRSEALKDMVPYDSIYITYGADVDLSLRIKAQGYRIAVCTKAKIWHAGSATNSKVCGLRAYFIIRNMSILMKRFHYRNNCPPAQTILSMLKSSVALGGKEGFEMKCLLSPVLGFLGWMDGLFFFLRGKDTRLFDLRAILLRRLQNQT